jgi:hypothetical protein
LLWLKHITRTLIAPATQTKRPPETDGLFVYSWG